MLKSLKERKLSLQVKAYLPLFLPLLFVLDSLIIHLLNPPHYDLLPMLSFVLLLRLLDLLLELLPPLLLELDQLHFLLLASKALQSLHVVFLDPLQVQVIYHADFILGEEFVSIPNQVVTLRWGIVLSKELSLNWESRGLIAELFLSEELESLLLVRQRQDVECVLVLFLHQVSDLVEVLDFLEDPMSDGFHHLNVHSMAVDVNISKVIHNLLPTAFLDVVGELCSQLVDLFVHVRTVAFELVLSEDQVELVIDDP